jgi:hypothetical protein
VSTTPEDAYKAASPWLGSPGDVTHQRRTSLLTKDEQSTSSIGSTLTWSLISSGACIRASLKILRLPLFSPQVSPSAPTPSPCCYDLVASCLTVVRADIVCGRPGRLGRCSSRMLAFRNDRFSPMVRIRFPPADSQSLSRSRFRKSRTPAFRAGLGSWLGDRVSRDAPGFLLRGNRRQYLCRAIFQYRSAADLGGGMPNEIRPSPDLIVQWMFESGLGSGKAEQDPLIVPRKRQT